MIIRAVIAAMALCLLAAPAWAPFFDSEGKPYTGPLTLGSPGCKLHFVDKVFDNGRAMLLEDQSVWLVENAADCFTAHGWRLDEGRKHRTHILVCDNGTLICADTGATITARQMRERP
jgi:hypothetical protein